MSPTARPSDDEVYETYLYLLARALVARQERVDLAEDGVEYNTIKYNPVGSANFVNPNLDVAYLEAWVAVDDDSPATLTVPAVTGRYYTAQLSDEWGDVIVNINERTMPDSPSGRFVLHAPGAAPSSADGVPIGLHSRKAKLLARVEIADDLDSAVALQHQFTLSSDQTPRIAPPIELPAFDNQNLIGADLYAFAEELLTQPPDPVASLASMRERVAAVAEHVASGSDAHDEVEQRIRTDVIPRMWRESTTQILPTQDGWLIANTGGRYGDKYHLRLAANLIGIWANDAHEAVYYITNADSEGHPNDGSAHHSLTFPADSLPSAHANSYWSIILVSIPDFRVVPNAIDRYNLNSYSPLVFEEDGSLRIDIAPKAPDDRPQPNWLPSPAGHPFSLTFRIYVPKREVLDAEWFPPPLTIG